MNFFQHQDAARKKTDLLVFLLLAAVLSLIVITTVTVAVFWYFLESNSTSINAANSASRTFLDHLWMLVNSDVSLWIAVGVAGVVSVGSIYKIIQLGRGGKYVAQSLGGRLLNRDTRDPDERKVLNVVEEMAIASGNPVPSVYLLEEEGINAFAAGVSRRDTVIGVTRGCIQHLNRDELQGVMAHEFSHIHNGDMKLNMRLIAILHGILLIGLIGYFLARSSAYGSRRSKGRAQQMILGVALMVIGYGGTFFGNIIKSAVSRQREFLADASAVQFTRNPDGIAGALKKIGGLSSGSHFANASASQFSHMYFGEGIKTALGGWTATHPPLPERIKRIDKYWDGKFPGISASHKAAADETSGNTGDAVTNSAMALAAGAAAAMHAHGNARISEDTVEHVGEIQPESIEAARAFLSQLPDDIHNAAHAPNSAKALVYCLLLDTDKDVRNEQAKLLQSGAHVDTLKVVKALFKNVLALPRQQHLMVVDLCIPALKELEKADYENFKKNLFKLIKADNQVSLFEWCLYRIVSHNIEVKEPSENRSLKAIADSAAKILSLVVIEGENEKPEKVFNLAISHLGKDFQNTQLQQQALSFEEIDQALNQLSQLKPLAKPVFLKALIEAINADGKVTATEAELFRAIADTLNCPVPPLTITG